MEAEVKKSVFATLNAIDCRKECKKKNGLTYLPWAWAWTKVKENYPSAFYTIYENAQGLNYHTDGRTAWVKTGVTIEDLEIIEYLPVMDYRNASIAVEKLTSFDVNKSIQRCLTKACARHGLGLYIFAGEDLPEGADDTPQETRQDGPGNAPQKTKATTQPNAQKPATARKPQLSGDLRAKAKEAWTIFVGLESVKAMDDNSKGTFFKAQLKSSIGKDDPTKLTLDEWDKVINQLDTLKVI